MKTIKSINTSKKQKGVALISVLLVFALATVIASDVISRSYRDIRRTANAISTKQAYLYSLAGEQFARQILYRDYIQGGDDKYDSLRDRWAQEFDTLTIESGQMSIEINDLQGRFNLNNLVENSVNENAEAEFSNLLRVLNISGNYTALLKDWLDEDNTAVSGGGEDSTYQSGNNAYLAANAPMGDRTELRLLKELSAQDYNTLKDYVVALPAGTAYNLNTLDAKILEALSTTLSNTQAGIIHQQQLNGGYSSVSGWVDTGEASDLASARNALDVKSEYFEVVVKTVYDERISVLRTQMYRNKENGEIQVIKRQQGFE